MKTFIQYFSLIILCISSSPVFGQWQQLNIPIPVEEPVISVLDLGDKLFVGTYEGTFKSTDEGLTWSSLTNNGIPESALIDRFAVMGNTIVAVDIRQFGGVYRSVDRGETWASSNTGLGNDAARTRTVYEYNGKFFLGVGAFNAVSEALYYSTDDGASWEVRNSGIIGTEKGVYEFASVGQNLFASVDGSGFNRKLYKTSDEGENWTEASPPFYGDAYNMVGISNYLIAEFFDLFRSTSFTPDTTSWVLIENGLPDASYNSIDADLNNVYLAVYEYGVYMSSDYGNSWVEMNNGFPAGAEVISIHRGSNYLYAGTYENNLFRYPLNSTGLSEESFSTSDFNLSQNYPNPFNPVTNIQFALPQSSFVTLEVYNSIGEKVEILVSKELSSGTYNFDWNAEGLSSGVYFYRLQIRDYIDIKKMILLR